MDTSHETGGIEGATQMPLFPLLPSLTLMVLKDPEAYFGVER